MASLYNKATNVTSESLRLRVRRKTDDEMDQAHVVLRPGWDPAMAAVIICDMWDAHHCVSAARRVAEMVPRMNIVVAGLRERGAFIVHAPADCMAFYRGTPARRLAMQAPVAQSPVPIAWNEWTSEEKDALPGSLTVPGPCSCASVEICGEAVTPPPWTRQFPDIDIATGDAVSDDGQEVFNLLQHRAIADVIVMGVHTNVCVLSRSYGIRQLVYWGKKPMLCRDLTDSFHRDPRGHTWGTDRIIAHIERWWCPTVTSDQLVERTP